MSYAEPGRLRGFFSSRTGVAVLVVVALAAAVATAVALQGEEEPVPEVAPPVTTTTTVPVPAPVTGGVLLGASTSPDVRGLAAEKAAVEDLERRIGRTLDINHNFYPWDEPFPTEEDRWDLASGRIPLISWNGKNVTTKTIAAGQYDDMIKQRARAVKALGQPVLIRWFWEMDGNKKSEFAGTPEQYIAAWHRIVGIFRAQGADNVAWVWCPNASAFNDGDAQPFYPGDDFVDWTCADGYNWAPGRAGDEYRAVQGHFRRLLRLGRPPQQAHHGRRVRRSGTQSRRKGEVDHRSPRSHQNGLSADAGRRLFQQQHGPRLAPHNVGFRHRGLPANGQ